MAKEETMRINLTEDRDYWVRPGQCVAYKTGKNVLVKRAFGEKAIEEGIATEVKPKSKSKSAKDKAEVTEGDNANGS